MKRFFTILVFFLFCSIGKVFAQRDTAKLFQVYQFLTSKRASERKQAVAYFSENAKEVDPHLLLMIADVVYRFGYKDSAIYWFYLGSIRTQYFISLQKEPSASALYGALHQIIGEKLNKYARKHLTTLSKKITEALDWDEKYPLDVSLLMENMGDSSKYIPTEQWQQNYNIVRHAYLKLSQDVLQPNYLKNLRDNEQ